ncbi:MAG: autotransporter domain-containing protein [Bradyrhizobium sp.]
MPDGTASFGISSVTGISFSTGASLGGWTFNAGASNYTFTTSTSQFLTFTGAGIVVNGGSVSITNSNALEFNNNSTAGNASITNNSSLMFLDNSTAGNASITNVGVSAIADFSLSSGPGNNGQLSAGSIAGSGQFYLGSIQVTVGGNNQNTTVSGVIGDCGAGGIACGNGGATGGSLVKVGSGTLTLTGVNTYTGATTINGGALEVDGSIASSTVTVNSGGTLSGSGTIGDPLINAGGTLAPGSVANPYGTLTINGPLTFAAGSFYNVNISPAANSATSVIGSGGTGTATLGGATVNASYAGGSYVAKQYTILTASGGVSGTFGSLVNTNLPSGFKASLGYDPDDVFLNLTLGFAVPGGLHGNQQAVGNALTNFFNNTGGIPIVYGTLNAHGLSQASGETATGTQQSTFGAMNLFMGAMTDPFSHGGGATSQGGASPYADPRDANAMFTKAMPVKADPFAQRWSVWASGFGGSQATDGNAATGSNNSASSIYGTAVGADYSLSPNTIAGFALAGGGTNFSVTNGGSGHSDLFQAGAFVRHTAGAAYVSAALAYGWQDVTTNRTVTVAGIDQLRARFNANAYSGRLESGYRFVAPVAGGVGITPYAAAQFTSFELPAYAEGVLSGSSAFALAYGAKSVTDTRSELGLRTDKSYALTDAILTLRDRLAWAHDYDPDRTVAATFQALPGASFAVNGAAQASDSALTTATVEVKYMNGWSVAATFEGEFSDVTRSYAGKGVVRYVW